jgi:hypothetical protein
MKPITGIVSILIAMGFLAIQAAAMQYGSFSLQPGAVQEIRIGSTYRILRVCNAIGSAGAILATIGDHKPHTLAPGLCVDDSGDVIKLQNQTAGVATGTYRPIRSNSVR